MDHNIYSWEDELRSEDQQRKENTVSNELQFSPPTEKVIIWYGGKQEYTK